MTIRMRPYQIQAAGAVDDDLREHDAVMVVMATGLGKTVLYGFMAANWPTGRVLVLAHREELVTQGAACLRDGYGCPVAVEMADQRATFEQHLFAGGDARAVVASVQSLSRPDRLARYDPAEFGLVVIDECHHCVPQNKTYWDIIRHFRKNPRLKILGVTATPDRGDELALGQVFQRVSYRFDIAEAIDEGWLVPLDQQFVHVEGLDVSSVRLASDGDLKESEVEAIIQQEELIHRIVSPLIEIAGGEQCLVFTAGVKTATGWEDENGYHPGIVDVICRHADNGVRKDAKAIHGKTDKDDRRNWLQAYARKEFQYLVGCDVFTEGFDEPSVSVLGIAKQTQKRGKYAQMAGRVTRPSREITDALNSAPDAATRKAIIAASAKPRGLIVDFVGNSGKHNLMNVIRLLGGKHADEAVTRAARLVAQAGGPVRVGLDLFAEAESELQTELKHWEAERIRLAEMERRRPVVAKAVYSSHQVDPFTAGSEDQTYTRDGYGRTAQPATAKQLDFLAKHDPKFLADHENLTKSQAGERIGEIMERWDKGLCTVKQAQTLERHGESGEVSKDKASMLLDLLAARRWKPRHYRLTRDRWRIRHREDGFAPIVHDPDVGPVILKHRFETERECRDWIESVYEEEESVAA